MTSSIKDLTASAGVTIDRLWAFLAVADKGSISGVADGDPSRQAQLSRQIRELGVALHAPLTRRQGRGIALTPAGEALATVLRELRSGLENVSRDEGNRVRDLVIAAGDSHLHWLLLPQAADLVARFPKVRLHFVASSDVGGDVQSGRCDWGLMSDPPRKAGLKRQAVGEWSFRLFVPRINGVAMPVTEQPFVEVTGDPAAPLRDLATSLDFEPRVAVRCETYRQAARLVESGRFAALLPSVAERDLRRAPVEAMNPASLGDAREPWRRKLVLLSRERTLEESPLLVSLFEAVAKVLRSGLDV